MGDSSGRLLAMFSVVGLAITQIVTEFNRVKYLQLSGENELTFG
jgi:hypothetical protein